MKYLSHITFATFLFLLVFTRSFAGIYILGLRIGEYLVALGLFIFSIFLFKNKEIDFPKEITLYLKIIFLSFLIVNYLTYTDILNKFTYKNSSYIWTIAYFILGYVLFGKYIDRNKFYFLFSGIVVLYIFGTGSYPDSLQILFKTIGDKFTFVKASDMLLAVVVTNLIAVNLFSKKTSNLYFLFSVGIFLPLLIQMSRGTAVGLLIFSLIYIGFNFKFYFLNIKNFAILILVLPIFFTLSTFRVTQFNFADIPKDQLETVVIQSAPDEIKKIKRVDNRNPDEIDPFWSFYIQDGRLFSTDGTFNWRLKIWQDQHYYQTQLNKNFFGYGYNVLLPVFDLKVEPQNIWNVGHDQQNRHVHNYLVNIYSRGGVFQFLIIFGFHIFLYYFYYKKFSNHYILALIIPLMFNSMTDITMEGVQFPINYYLVFGYIVHSGIQFKKEAKS